MSVISTITIRRHDALRKIAEIAGAIEPFFSVNEKFSEDDLIAKILTALTANNVHREFQDNNFHVVPNDYQPDNEYEKFYEETGYTNPLSSP